MSFYWLPHIEISLFALFLQQRSLSVRMCFVALLHFHLKHFHHHPSLLLPFRNTLYVVSLFSIIITILLRSKIRRSFLLFLKGGVWSFRFFSVLVLTTDFHEIQNTTVFICCSNKKSKQNIQKPHSRQKSADVFPQQTKRDTESERVYKIKLACSILNSNVLSIQNRDDNVRVANIPT